MGTQLIGSDPKIMMGKPVVSGTRIHGELILEKLAAGETVEQILKAHPSPYGRGHSCRPRIRLGSVQHELKMNCVLATRVVKRRHAFGCRIH